MRYAGTERDDDAAWFRLGQLEVTTPILVLLVWTATLLIWVVEGTAGPVTRQLWLDSSAAQNGEVWRLITWPFAHGSFQLWDIINAAIFWLFGTELERQTGRRAFLWLVGSSVGVIGIAGTVLAAILGDPLGLFDLDLLALTVVLLYCAEHPTRPFFFNIPAWAIAAVIVALEVLNDLANREFTRLLTVIVSAGIIALIAKRSGLLSNYDRIPDLAFGGGGDGSPKPPKPQKSSKKGGGISGKFGRKQDAEIVAMPTQPLRPQPRVVAEPEATADDLALDALLDKISANGIDSLSDAERQQLDDIRERRRTD